MGSFSDPWVNNQLLNSVGKDEHMNQDKDLEGQSSTGEQKTVGGTKTRICGAQADETW